MKTITPHSFKIIIIIFCMFTLGNTYSQKKKITNKTLFGIPVKTGTINPKNGYIRCATTEYEQFLQKKNPARMTNEQFEAWVNPLVAKYKTMRTSSKTASPVITIPVVVHVIYDGQPIGTAPNITDAQVQSQIKVMNEDYSKTGAGSNTNSVGADTQIQFVLAKQDPNGNPTNGIDRASFCQSSWSEDDIQEILKPATIWDPTLYMNMWSVNFTDNTLLGYAQFPDASGLSGLDPLGGAANTDGVVSNYNVFGSIAYDVNNSFLLEPTATYDKGRTMSHEVGHWLGLRHIWGDGTGDEAANLPDCTASDFCSDTPQAGWEHYDCGPYDTCTSDPGSDMPENYMDYSNDACMNIFTTEQSARIRTIIDNATRRSTLKTSTKATVITPVAIDAEVKIATFNCDIDYGCATPPPPSNKQVSIYNRGTTPLTSVTLNYTINGGANQTFAWTGTLAQNQSADVTLLNTNSYGTLNVSATNVNGATDGRLSNNNASRLYAVQVNPNHNYTTYTFKLQRDLYASETSWDLKDSKGVIVTGASYCGGGSGTSTAYNDATTKPALVTKTWNLVANQCYTFSINDSYGDGICCGGGVDGSYQITTNTGAIVVASGGSFGTIKKHNFTTNTLGTNKFEALNDIYLYPNPTKGTLNIRVPNNFGLLESFTISNSLGQIISRKEVSKENDLILNTSTLSNGVYFITVVKEDQKKTLQFIKE